MGNVNTESSMATYGTGRGNRAFRPEEVNAIRTAYAQGGETYLSLAMRYDVSEQTISRIITLRTYRPTSRAGAAAMSPEGILPTRLPGKTEMDAMTARLVKVYEEHTGQPVPQAPEGPREMVEVVDNGPLTEGEQLAWNTFGFVPGRPNYQPPKADSDNQLATPAANE